jgi:D-glycero-alpha-D-manno-heptose 1-phosphate guanylyltransferase
VINGDTFLAMNYQAMYQQHIESGAILTMALREISNCQRYGSLEVDKQKIMHFNEKATTKQGYINAGVYLLNPNIFSTYTLDKKFSFETDFLFPHIAKLNAQAFFTKDYFIDIGIPEDYQKAQQELPSLPGASE